MRLFQLTLEHGLRHLNQVCLDIGNLRMSRIESNPNRHFAIHFGL